MTKFTPPPDLSSASLRFWESVTGAYGLRPDELRVLEDCCREIDLIERLQDALPKTKTGLTVRGSMGQNVAHPLLGEIRQHRSTLGSLLKQLKLFDLGANASKDQPESSDMSASARKAAIARWGRNG